MVRMIVREENPVDMPDAKAKLRKPNHSATATVDENAFLTSLNQCRGAKCIDLCIGYSGAEKCHTKNVIGRWNSASLLPNVATTSSFGSNASPKRRCR